MFNFTQKSIETEIGNIIVCSRIATTGDCQVYKCMDATNFNTNYAIKISKMNRSKVSAISNEPRRYFSIDNDKYKQQFIKKAGDLGKYVKIPKFYCSGQFNNHEYNITTLFGKSLDFHTASSFEELKEIALTLITTLEYIHSRGWVYADVKGGNIVKEIDESKGYAVIDVGGMETYDYNNDPFEDVGGFRGTQDYASLSAHSNLVLFPRDDLESFGYLIAKWIYGSLKWQNIKKNDHVSFYNLKFEFLHSIDNPKLNDYFNIVLTKERNEPVDYNAIRNLWL